MKIINIQRFRQLCRAACVPTCLQMIIFHLTNKLIRQPELVELINSYPDGAGIKESLEKLRKFKIKHRYLCTIKRMENWLDKNRLILSGDDGFYMGEHCVVIVGYDEENFHLADPNRAEIRLANKDKVFENSDEFYGVFK